MKLGLSSYSICRYFLQGKLNILEGMEWMKEKGFEHIEIVPFGIELVDEKTGEHNEELIWDIVRKSEELELPISAFSLNADLLIDDETEQESEILRVMNYVDMAAKLRVSSMRFDASSFRRPFEKNTIIHFEKDMEKLVKNCRKIVDYAAQYDFMMTLENHGFYLNGSDRIQRMFYEIDRPNYKHTLDVGNFLCVDEDPVVAVKKNIHLAEIVHLKDFFIRRADRLPDAGIAYSSSNKMGFLTSLSGTYKLLGSIVGLGDMDMWSIIKAIKESGFDGYVSIEFEGLEDPFMACEWGRENALGIWENV